MQRARTFSRVWYGWIPILTEAPLFRRQIVAAYQAVLPSSSSSEYTRILKADFFEGENRAFEDSDVIHAFPPDFTKFIRQYFGLQDHDVVLCYLRTLDGDRQGCEQAKRIAITFDAYFRINRMAIFDVTSNTIEAAGQIEIDSKGLMKLTLENMVRNVDIPDYAKHIYFGVRDIYHEHIYSSETDSLLKAAEAANATDAVAKISKDFQKKIPRYHRRIADKLAELSEPRCRDFPGLIIETNSLISSARGEMIHALALATLFQVDGEFLQSIERALSSFDNLKGQLDTLADTKHSKASSMLSTAALIFAVFSTFFVTRQEIYSYIISQIPNSEANESTIISFWYSAGGALLVTAGVVLGLICYPRWSRG